MLRLFFLSAFLSLVVSFQLTPIQAHAEDSRALSQSAKEALTQAIKVIRNVTADAIIKAQAKAKARAAAKAPNYSFALKPRTFNCPQSGSIGTSGSVSGTRVSPRASSADVSLAFNACNGVNGSLNTLVIGSMSKTEARTTSTVSGNVGISCPLGLTGNADLDIVFEGSVNYGNKLAQGTVSGTVEGRCGDNLILLKCSWDKVNIRNKEALKAGCGGLGMP